MLVLARDRTWRWIKNSPLKTFTNLKWNWRDKSYVQSLPTNLYSLQIGKTPYVRLTPQFKLHDAKNCNFDIKYYRFSMAQLEFFNIWLVFGGIPRPSNRTSSPPMLLKWFWPRGLSDSAEWRILNVKWWSENSVHCSFMLNLLMTRNSSETKSISVNRKITRKRIHGSQKQYSS